VSAFVGVEASPQQSAALVPGRTLTTATTRTTTSARQSPPAPSGLTTGFYQANIEGGPAAFDCAPPEFPTATVAPHLDSLFANQRGPGWLAGDATYSTALPKGQEAFVFSDTLVGRARRDGAAVVTGVAHNSEMTGTMPHLVGDLRGTYSSPKALIPGPHGSNLSWQVASTYMEKGQQLVFVNQFAAVRGSPFDVYTGRSGIAVMSLSSGKPTLKALKPLRTDAVTQWGNALTRSGGFDYVYGISMNSAEDWFSGMKVARVAVGQSLDLDAWRYWNGYDWVAGERNAIASSDIPSLTGVIPLAHGSGYMGIGIDGSAGQTMTVDVTFSCSPTGPWGPPASVYDIPETTHYPDELAYIATFHPELSKRTLVVSYNVNSLDGISALERNDHQYQPRFIELNV
jgi:hypothetical protein